MSLLHQSKRFILKWNNTFVYDRWYRQKYKIPFGSEAHRKVCQIDIVFEYLEELLFMEYQTNLEKKKENEKLISQGVWLREQIEEEMSDKLFKNIQSGLFTNDSTSQIKFEE